MTIFYETGRYDKMVVPVEVEKSTDKSVWIDGLRNAKRSGWQNYFETESEAWDFLIARAEAKIEKHAASLLIAEGNLDKIHAARKLQTNA